MSLKFPRLLDCTLLIEPVKLSFLPKAVGCTYYRQIIVWFILTSKFPLNKVIFLLLVP